VIPSERPTSRGLDTTPAIAESTEAFVMPTSLGQERFWDLDRLNPGNPTWTIPVRFRLEGVLDSNLVERAFNEIVRRHETLRTTFRLVDGHLAQIIRPFLKVEVPVTDLRDLPTPERDAEIDRLSLQEARERFDVIIGPLFRVRMFRVQENEHVLLVTPHHLVADYWSIGLISNELGVLYEAYSRGVEPILPELLIQYGDFAVWQREQAEGTIVQKELAYWKEQLQNLPLVEFPTNRPRSPFPTYDASITSILLSVKVTDAIKSIADREGTTFFNTMLGAFAIALYHYTRQINFGVATQMTGRTSTELEPLIGLFVNNVVLRMDLSGDPLFPQLLARVHDVGLQSLANQNLRFEQLLKELRPEDYPSHHTLFRVNFICQRDPVKPLEFSGIKLTVIPSKSQGALYELNVFLVLRAEGWRLACEYNTDLFDLRTITGLLSDYRTLLEHIVRDPSRRVSEFPWSEGATLLTQQNAGVSRASPSAGTILGRSAVATATSLAAPTPSGGSFSEAYVMPSSVAQRRFWLLEEIVPGNPALHMRACVRLTGALSQDKLEQSFQHLVDRHEILRTTFERVNDQLVQVIASSLKISVPMTSLEDMTEEKREARLHPAIYAETSAPFDLSRGPLIRARLFRLSAQQHVLVISTHHIVADGWSQGVIQHDLWTIYEALLAGHEPSLQALNIQYGDFVHWQQQWLASDEARKTMEFWKEQLAAPLPVLNFPTDRPPRNRPAHKGAMETLLLPQNLIRSLKTLSQSQDISLFMMLLTAYSALLSRYSHQEYILIGVPVANRKPETEPLIGPFAGPMSLLLDVSGNPTLRELLFRVRDLTVEALRHSDLPFEVLLDNLDVRSVRGRNPLSQIYFFYQTAFLQPRELRDLTVTPLPDFGLGTHFELQLGLLERQEGVRAQLEYNPDLFEPATIRSILENYRKTLEIVRKNLECRIDQLAISVRAKQETALADSSQVVMIQPKNETERQLTSIWEKLLQVRPIGVSQNYFELGGNSLLAVRLFSQIEEVFKVRLPLSTLFEAQTIEAFARILCREGTAPNWSSLVEIQPGSSRPRFFCIHGAGGNVLIYRDLSRYLGSDQPFYGLQAQGLDGERPYLTRVEDMAALYIREIRTVQPHGPYFLGGYCLGGTIALEMAQQLKTCGEEIGLLAMFDTINWSRIQAESRKAQVYYQAQRLLFHVRNFLLLNSRDQLKFFQAKMRVLRSRSNVWLGMLLGKLEQRGSKAESLILAQIWKINDQAILSYVPQTYAGVITDFRPIKQYAKYIGADMKWGRLALGQEIVTLPVYPAGMLVEPFVKHLAAALRATIDKAIQAKSTANGDNLRI
jgi:non-ribosomal peptide synthetase component F/thioesterase domain-containing protein